MLHAPERVGCLDALTAPGVARSLDAFVTKTVTPLPREGNPPPRIAETDARDAELDRPREPRDRPIPGRDAARLAELGVPLWVSVGGFAAHEYAESCARLDERPEVAAIELNVSCPNVPEAPESAAEIVAPAGRRPRSRSTPSSRPRSPTSPPPRWRAGDAGADGLSLVNTLRGLALDERTLQPRLALAAGGYSGPALKPVALAAVFAAYRATRLPIVGMGGVASGRDALELIAAGAAHVALGTVLFADPDAPARIRAELAAEAAAHGFAIRPTRWVRHTPVGCRGCSLDPRSRVTA